MKTAIVTAANIGLLLLTIAAFFWTASWTGFVVAAVAVLVIGAWIDSAWLRSLSDDARRRELESRVRNPPS